VKELRRKEVTNIKYKIRGPLDTHLVGNPNRELDIREAISFLENQGYLVERYEIPDLSTYDFILFIQIISKTLSNMGGLLLLIPHTRQIDTIVACSPCIIAILMDIRTLELTFL